MARCDIAREIEKLDAEKDHVRIYHLLVGWEFPWDVVRALEMALYRTFCVPSISRLLDRTGEFARRPQQRYDDTSLLMTEIIEHGYDSERGREALRRINRVHGQFEISNDDFLYVLSTFLFEPVKWIDRYGWRQTTAKERQASYFFWGEVGRRMNIKAIPASYAEFETWALAYEKATFKYSETNARVGASTRDLFLSWFPALVRPLVEKLIYALLDDDLLDAFGFPKPTRGMRTLASGLLEARGRIVALLPARKRSKFLTRAATRTYLKGYQISQLGPPGFEQEVHR